MKSIFICVLALVLLIACKEPVQQDNLPIVSPSIVGTWKLLEGITVEKNDSTIKSYTKDVSFIKVINATHFSFLLHDLKRGKDSSAIFSSGGGTYSLLDNNYTEHLEYCSDRDWEGHDFTFTVSIKGDTLVQQGVEKIDSLGINRLNIEKYIRLK